MPQLRTAIGAAAGVALLATTGALLFINGFPGDSFAVAAILIAATVAGIAGFAFSALCGALLFHLMESAVYVVEVMSLCSIAIQMLSVATLWRSIDWRNLAVLLAGGVFGVPAGVYLLLHLHGGAYRDVIGILLVGYGAYLLLRYRPPTLRTGPLSDAVAGFVGGITGGLAGFPGAFVTIWCGMKGWDKTRQRAVYQPFILGMQPITLIAIYLMRPGAADAAHLDWRMIVFVPAALLGAWFGLRIFKGLSDRQFQYAVSILLVVAGIGLVL
jgi:uncharacterized membrane protein YfcA